VTLYIGARNWPAPIPIISKGKGWYFDTKAGKDEILFRRIGRNEMSAIEICRELVRAEQEYLQQHHEYAQKFFGDEGQHNGLYWEIADNRGESPVGPLLAQAVTDPEVYARRSGVAVPYRGYLFHMLTSQGNNAPGGAKDYRIGVKMTEGFAFVAYPAEYRSSGVKTLLVSADGVVFEKDLGQKTKAIAKSMFQFNPDSTWQKTEEEPQKP
jgi:hypothetical protein